MAHGPETRRTIGMSSTTPRAPFVNATAGRGPLRASTTPFVEDELESPTSSIGPGESLVIDGELVRTFADASAWYAARREVLVRQRKAFVDAQQPVPDGLDDLITSAGVRVPLLAKLGSAPVADSQMEGLLGWADVYAKALRDSDERMESIAIARIRATKAQLEDVQARAQALEPSLRELQRSAFRGDKTSTLKEIASTFAKLLDAGLVAQEWVKEAATAAEDIKYLGTTLRTQKALFGSRQSWDELLIEKTNARVVKILSLAETASKVLAAWDLVDGGLEVLRGGKTASDRTSAGIRLAPVIAGAGGTLLGASSFFVLYSNFYIGPMVGRILGQINQLKDQMSAWVNRPLIVLGNLDMVNWSIEPGGRDMFDFMRRVMRAKSVDDISSIPSSVRDYFAKYSEDFDAGTPPRHGVELDYADFDDKRSWVFGFREDIWGMLYGSMRP